LPFTSGQFHPVLKESVISPLLKKLTLDEEQLSNYCPISNLSISHIQNNRTCCPMSTYWSRYFQWSSRSSSICKVLLVKQESWGYLPDGEEIMTLAFFVLIQYRCVTDRRTDGHVGLAKTRDSIVSRG